VVVPGCLALTWWQVERALSGNTLSWVYSFEWPFFAGYALYMWWRLIHEEPHREPVEPAGTGPVGSSEARAHGAAAPRPEERVGPDEHDSERDPELALAEYNRYLAALNASGRRKRW
jgi:hypothetical protein